MEEKSENNVRTYIAAMMKTLEEVGAGDAVIRGFNSIAVDTAKFDCDLYRFLKMDAEAVNSYTGEYMQNYDWSEFMTAYLAKKVLS